MDYEGIKTLLRDADGAFPHLSHLWLDGGYRGEGKGADWVEKTLGWNAQLVERRRKPAPTEVLMAWAREWAKEGVKVDFDKFMPPRGFQVLPRRWVVERTIAWIDQNRRMRLVRARGRSGRGPLSAGWLRSGGQAPPSSWRVPPLRPCRGRGRPSRVSAGRTPSCRVP